MNCQTQRALQGELNDGGKMAQPLPASAKPETNMTPALKKPESKTVPSSKDKTPIRVHPIVAETKAIPTGASSQDAPQAIPEAQDKEAFTGKAEKLTSEVEKKPSEEVKVDPHIPRLPVLQDTAVSQEDIKENLSLEDKLEPKMKPTLSNDHNKHEVVSIETPTAPVADNKVAMSLSSPVAELPAPEEISEELKPDSHIKMLAQTTSYQENKSQQDSKAVPATESMDVTSLTDRDTLIQEPEVYTKDMEIKVRSHFLCA